MHEKRIHSAATKQSQQAAATGSAVMIDKSAGQLPTERRMQYLLSGGIAAGWGLLITATLLDTAPAQPLRPQLNEQNESSTDSADDRQPRGESPALGVVVAQCPGDAVCVRGTVWGSPAEQADIREGDYILSLNGKKVSSPAELRRAVEQSDADQKASVLVWREGNEITKELYLAKQAEELPAGHRAWLGVQLKESQEGVELARVIEYGPADEAGLRDGDIVLQLNGDSVSSVEEFVDRVGDLGPGEQLDLLVRRESQRQKVTVELGTVDDAPMAFLRQAFGTPSWEGESATSIETDAMVDATLDVLRQQIRELQHRLDELNGARGDGAARRDGASRSGSSNQGQLPAPGANVDASLSPRGQPVPQIADAATEPGVQLAAFPIDAALGSLVAAPQLGANQLGAQRGRNNRDWNNWQRYRNYYNRNGNQFYNYSPYYRSPYYGNSYYRYGGRQYYYSPRFGYGYGYGLRNGLRLGPNLGVYWY